MSSRLGYIWFSSTTARLTRLSWPRGQKRGGGPVWYARETDIRLGVARGRS